jgi:hypothetical protein
VIDASGVGLSAEIGLAEFADFTRGKDRKGDQGLGRLFGLPAPRGLCGVTVDNDTATAVSPFFRMHGDAGRQRQRHSHRSVARLAGKACGGYGGSFAVAWRTASSTPSRASPTRTTWPETTPKTDNPNQGRGTECPGLPEIPRNQHEDRLLALVQKSDFGREFGIHGLSGVPPPRSCSNQLNTGAQNWMICIRGQAQTAMLGTANIRRSASFSAIDAVLVFHVDGPASPTGWVMRVNRLGGPLLRPRPAVACRR